MSRKITENPLVIRTYTRYHSAWQYYACDERGFFAGREGRVDHRLPGIRTIRGIMDCAIKDGIPYVGFVSGPKPEWYKDFPPVLVDGKVADDWELPESCPDYYFE